MIIKHATKKDFKTLLELQLLFIKSVNNKSDFEKYKKKWAKVIRDYLNKPKKFFCLIAYEHNIPTGHIDLCINKDGISKESSAYVNDIFVKKEFRQRGIAKALMHEAIKFCKNKTIKKIRLGSSINNKPALATWKKLGFRAIDIGFERKI